MLREEDVVRLRHMLDAARKAIGFVMNRQRTDLDTDDLLVFGIVRAIEVIGEAARQVTPEGQALCPSIPWASMIAMRNRIVHAYFDINLDRVWETVTDDLPALIPQLERILASV